MRLEIEFRREQLRLSHQFAASTTGRGTQYLASGFHSSVIATSVIAVTAWVWAARQFTTTKYLGVAGMTDDAMSRSNTMSSPKLNNNSRDQVRELSAHEVGLVAGAKVLEIPIGPITIQLNFDNGCWAVWNGKDFAGGGCPT